MDQNVTETKKSLPPFLEKTWTHIKKFKFYYMYGAFVIFLALSAALGLIIDSNIADLSNAREPYNEWGESRVYASLYTFIETYDDKQTEYLKKLDAYNKGEGKPPEKKDIPTYAPNPLPASATLPAPLADAVVQAVKNRYDGTASSFELWLLDDGVDLLNDLNGMIYNMSKISFFSLFQFLFLLLGAIGMIIIMVKSEGEYNIGFTPFFGSNTPWFVISLTTLCLAGPAAIYALLREEYTWSTALFIAMAFSSTILSAFGQFALRKQGAGKLARLLIPTAGSYVFSLIYFLVGMGNAAEGGTLGALSLIFSDLMAIVVLFIAPLWINAAYLMTGSVMATVLPYVCFGVTFSLFPSVIRTMQSELYAVILFYLALVALVGSAIALIVMLAIKMAKKLPIPADLACEMYEEGAPEITIPEAYLAAKAEKAEKKVEKKAKKNDFAFLDEDEKAETADDTTTV